MTTMHCTYPDGETSEARFAWPMDLMLDTMSPDWPEREPSDTLVDMPAFSEAA